jgi:methionyl-tRNA formyltransferase
MKEIGARVLVETVSRLAEGTLKETPQSAIGNEQLAIENSQISETHSPLTIHHSPFKHAPKITTQICQIDWTKSVDEIHNLIRGLSPYPAAFTELGDQTIKIFKSEKELAIPTSKPGRWESNGKTYLKFAAKDGYIYVKDVQLEGKKRMNVEDFLRGYRFK